jgi:hypothetical protein
MTETKTFTFEEYSKVVQDYQREQARAQKMEGEVVDLKKKIEPLEKIDIAALKARSEELDLLKRQSAKTPEEIEKLVKEKERAIRAEVQKELEDNKQAMQRYLVENKELRVVDRVHNEIGGLFNEDVQDDVKGRIRSVFDLNDEGQFVVKDEKGAPRYSKADRTKLMTPKEYAEELREMKPSWAKPTGVAGGIHAVVKTNGAGGEMTAQKWLSMTPAQRGTYSLADQRKFGTEAVKAQH